MSGGDRVVVAVFRPDDGRATDTAEFIRSLGGDPVIDPLLETQATGSVPRDDAEYVIFTSPTGVDSIQDTGWGPGGATVCAIGEQTARALDAGGYDVDVIPSEYSSAGLVETLGDAVAGTRVEIARSNRGSEVLPTGLERAGAYVHETILYEIVRPADSGASTERAANGELDAVLFSSPLTVDHFVGAATERGIEAAVRAAVNGPDIVVGAIGDPTKERATDHGLQVDVVPDVADIEALAAALVERAAPTHHR